MSIDTFGEAVCQPLVDALYDAVETRKCDHMFPPIKLSGDLPRTCFKCGEPA